MYSALGAIKKGWNNVSAINKERRLYLQSDFSIFLKKHLMYFWQNFISHPSTAHNFV